MKNLIKRIYEFWFNNISIRGLPHVNEDCQHGEFYRQLGYAPKYFGECYNCRGLKLECKQYASQ